MNRWLNSFKIIVQLPLFAVAVFVGILEAIASDVAIFLLAVAGVLGVTLVGTWTLFPTFVVYACLRSFASVVNELSSQVNFVGRVYRDNQ